MRVSVRVSDCDTDAEVTLPSTDAAYVDQTLPLVIFSLGTHHTHILFTAHALFCARWLQAPVPPLPTSLTTGRREKGQYNREARCEVSN